MFNNTYTCDNNISAMVQLLPLIIQTRLLQFLKSFQKVEGCKAQVDACGRDQLNLDVPKEIRTH